MSCYLKNCNCNPITQDGYCKKHGYYTESDEKYIVKHVRGYLSKIELSEFIEDKLDISLNLWFYLTYKKDFILKHPHYHNVVIKKGEEIINEMKKQEYGKKLEKFNDFHFKIKGYK